MADTLGILVTTDKHLDSVIELVNAAHDKGKEVQARGNGYHGREEEVPGVGFKDFATQGRNAEMLAEMDRYVVF